MRAGDMDRRITIQVYSYETDGIGGIIESWTDFAEVWAQVTQQSGREFFGAGAIQSERKVVFRLRWLDGITVLHRVVFGGREYNIHEVRELGRHEGLELHTTSSG